MTESLARRERAALCDLALELGASAPTLCAGWTAKDLVIHLVLRERKPLASAGIVVPPLSRFTERASRALDREPLDDLVARLRSPGWMFALPAADRAANTFEYLVHHEDLRRGAPGWEPRALGREDVEALWAQLRRGARLFGRELTEPTVLRRADTGETVVAKPGDDPVTVTGDVVELILHAFGRTETRVERD